jgi:hypothetical protein
MISFKSDTTSNTPFMENSEKQIALIENISRFPETYTFYLTNKRLVAINKKSLSTAFVSLGLVGAAIDIAIEKQQGKKKKELESLSLDEILQKDKKSFAIPYSNVEWFWLHDSKSRWKNQKIEIRLKGINLHRNKWNNSFEMQENQVGKFIDISESSPDFILTKDQFEQLSTILPNIPELNGKVYKK